jgi:hypothetical protein
MEDTLGSADRAPLRGGTGGVGALAKGLAKAGQAAAGFAKAGPRRAEKSAVSSARARKRLDVSASPAGGSTSLRHKVSEPSGAG